MRQWKVALSVAVLGALAAPVVFDTYSAEPTTSGFTPLGSATRSEITTSLARMNYCREFETMPMDKAPREADECYRQRGLLNQGEYYSSFSAAKYAAINVAAMIAGFCVSFGLAMLLPALARRYWRWLKA